MPTRTARSLSFERGGQDFGGRRCLNVDEQDERNVGEVLGSAGLPDLLPAITPAKGHDGRVGQEQLGRFERGLQEPAGTKSQVQNEPFEAGLLQSGDRLAQLARSFGAELLDRDVADLFLGIEQNRQRLFSPRA